MQFLGPKYGGNEIFHRYGNVTAVDSMSADMLPLVDTHWYQYPPLNPLWHSIIGFVILVLGVISIFGNFVVISIFSKTKTLRSPSNWLVVNLALSDFLMMSTMAPPMIYNCYKETWMFGPQFCMIYGMFGSLFGCVSIWSMVAIAMDRYNVIVRGFNGKPLTNKRVALQLLGVWIFSIGWTLGPVFGWNRYVPEGNMTVCGTDYLSKDWTSRSYLYCYGFWVYFLPLIIICFAYWYILKAVIDHEKVMRDQAKKMGVASLRTSDNADKSAEHKLAKVALTTIALWFMAWTPYLVINAIGIMDLSPISPLSTVWGSLFAKANAVYNPIVYGISHPKYRAALNKEYPSLSCASQPEVIEDTKSAITTVAAATIETTQSA